MNDINLSLLMIFKLKQSDRTNLKGSNSTNTKGDWQKARLSLTRNSLAEDEVSN